MDVKIATFCLLLLFADVYGDCDYYDDGDDCVTDSPRDSCVFSNCRAPNCSCFGKQPDIPINYRPQFVMLTFDDAITVTNIETYRDIVKGRSNRGNRRPIKLTFFVSHEYNNYELTNELYSQGHEIAVHSISHESNTDLWRSGSPDKWKKEMVGMRTMLSTFGFLPQSEILGHRAPFLQTAGDITFDMLKRERFLYDSSMPTRTFMDPPIWPYTLDYGYSPQDCQIQPCPSGTYAGLWEVPMIQYSLKSREGTFFCSMADACTPQPKTKADTVDFLMSNFRRHYQSNKAPFPVFMHEAWLQDEQRLRGYLAFLDEILKYDDVFVVTVRDVVEYMKRPVDAERYSDRTQEPAKLCREAKSCSYQEPLRNMKSCDLCPPYYPWVGTPLGRRKPTLGT